MKTKQGKNACRRTNPWKGLVRTLLLVFGPLFILSGFTLYHLEFKEQLLKVSESPEKEHHIEFIEQGETTDFGPSSIKLTYNDQHIDRMINNDGEDLNESNVTIVWTSDDTALITLDGAEQNPEFIHFDSRDTDVFDTVQE